MTKVKQIKQTLAPDLVHVSTVAPSVFFHLQTLAEGRCPTLLTQQLAARSLRAGSADTIYGQAIRQADWVTCCSHAVRDEMLRWAPEIAHRTSVILNGADVPARAPTPLPAEPRLLCLGRLVSEKGFDRALKALPAVRDRFPAVQLTIAGDGPERGNLETLASALSLSDAVEFAGPIPPPDVPAVMNDATLVIMPSRIESFGLVALEAALMARPVVAARVGGLAEVVEHDRTGVLVDADHEGELSHAVNALLADPARMSRMGHAARKRARSLFAWERYVGDYESLYRKLVLPRRKEPV
jgi:glycogen(starch) synthase